MAGQIIIQAGREKPIRQQHPWIFSRAIAHVSHAEPGDIVTVLAQDGSFLARGYWNPKSQIQVRLLTWHDEPIDEAWWRRQLQRAIASRQALRYSEQQALRLVNAESDFLPGLIVDEYAGYLVLQALTLHIDQQKQMLARLLAELTSAKGIYERSDVDVRGKEGLKASTGLLWGEEPPPTITIKEQPIFLNVDVRRGHKTGYYLDQRASRAQVAGLLARSAGASPRILNVFSYTGGFGTMCAFFRPEAEIIHVDSSADALKLALENATLNQQAAPRLVTADAFDFLRQALRDGEQYDCIILDPPKFAHNQQQVEKATRGYKDLNLHAFKLLKQGGILATFSCSGAITADLFQKVVFGALADSGRQAQILQQLGASEDHPVALSFPEGTYLKGLLLRVW